MVEVIYAGGIKGENARADGNGGFLKRGYYVCHGKDLIGPFDTKSQAELVATISCGTKRHLHESELYTGERAVLRALRKKGIVATVGLYLTHAARNELFGRSVNDAETRAILPASAPATAAERDRLAARVDELEGMKPFSTYPEDRAKLLSLAAKVNNPGPHDEAAAVELADLVVAILDDERVSIEAASTKRPYWRDYPSDQKVLPTLSFEGGILSIKAQGYGKADGSGELVFKDGDAEWCSDPDDHEYRFLRLPKSELEAIRNHINSCLGPYEDAALLATERALNAEMLTALKDAARLNSVGKPVLAQTTIRTAIARAQSLNKTGGAS